MIIANHICSKFIYYNSRLVWATFDEQNKNNQRGNAAFDAIHSKVVSIRRRRQKITTSV